MLRPESKILVVKTRSMGDNIIMLPALRLLRERFPTAEIDVLTVTESAAPLRPLLFIDGIYSFQKRGIVRRLWQTAILLRKIRNKHFDLAINLQASKGSEKVMLLSGAKKRLIYPYIYGKSSKYSHFHIGKSREIKQTFMEDIDALRPLGVSDKGWSFDYPVSETNLSKAKDIVTEYAIPFKKFIVIHPGGDRSEKRWSSRNFARLIDIIDRKLLMKSIVIYTKNEHSIYKGIFKNTETEPIGLSLPFDLLTGLIKSSLVFIGNDSAPHHLACALNIPSIVLMSRDRRNTWHPYNEKYHRVIVGALKNGKENPIERITVDDVFSTLKELIAVL